MSSYSTHVVPATAEHTHTIIFLHGRGSNATEFCSEFFESQDRNDAFLTDLFPHMRWVFPGASLRWADWEGEEMHQWFDMASVRYPSSNPESQKPGMKESVEFIIEVVRNEVKEVEAKNVFLAGISQGCATGLMALLQNGLQLGAFVGLSSWLPLGDAFSEFLGGKEQLGKNPALTTPMLLTHSIDDDVILVENGRDLERTMRELGVPTKYVEYADGGHWVNEPQGIDDMVQFLREHGA